MVRINDPATQGNGLSLESSLSKPLIYSQGSLAKKLSCSNICFVEELLLRAQSSDDHSSSRLHHLDAMSLLSKIAKNYSGALR